MPQATPFVVVLNEDKTWKEIVAIQDTKGGPADYDGHARFAAFEMVYGRKGTDKEVIALTRPFAPRTVVVDHSRLMRAE